MNEQTKIKQTKEKNKLFLKEDPVKTWVPPPKF